MKIEEVKRDKWDARFLALAQHLASWSIDPSTKVGCVIVGPSNDVRALGYNGFPRNIEDAPGRLERPNKYVWFEHAERNAIYTAARTGVPIEGCRMYLNWFPCLDCARAIVQVGLTEIIAVEPDWSSDPWGPQFVQARTLLCESDVQVRFVKSEITSMSNSDDRAGEH